MNSDNFDDIIKQKADIHQSTVPPDAWDNINKKDKKRRFVIFWWNLSSLLILGILFTCIYSSKTNKDAIAVNKSNAEQHLLIQPTKINNNSGGTGTANNSSDNSTATKNQLDSNNVSSNELTNDINKSTNALKANITNQHPQQQTQNQFASSSIEDKNIVAVTKHYNAKKYSFAKKAKYKGITTNASVDNDVTVKTNSSAPNTNNDIAEDNKPEKENNNNTKPIQNDLTATNTNTKTDQQKKTAITDSLIKAKEKDVAKTKAANQNKKETNAVKKTALVLDFSVTPFSPIQHFDQPSSVMRTNDIDTVHSVYAATSVQSKLQSSTAFGVAIKKNIGKKIMIGTGIQYAQVKEEVMLSGIETITKYTAVQRLSTNAAGAPYLINDTIATTTSGTRVINAINSYKFFSIPLLINYTLISHKVFSLGFTGGIYLTFASYHNSIDGKLQSNYSNGILADNEKNNLATDILGGLHLSWLISKKFELFTEPNFRYNTNAYKLKNTFINKNINQAGISAGVSYLIKKKK